jgi:hypothetical protein
LRSCFLSLWSLYRLDLLFFFGFINHVGIP